MSRKQQKVNSEKPLEPRQLRVTSRPSPFRITPPSAQGLHGFVFTKAKIAELGDTNGTYHEIDYMLTDEQGNQMHHNLHYVETLHCPQNQRYTGDFMRVGVVTKREKQEETAMKEEEEWREPGYHYPRSCRGATKQRLWNNANILLLKSERK